MFCSMGLLLPGFLQEIGVVHHLGAVWVLLYRMSWIASTAVSMALYYIFHGAFVYLAPPTKKDDMYVELDPLLPTSSGEDSSKDDTHSVSNNDESKYETSPPLRNTRLKWTIEVEDADELFELYP